MTSETIIAEWPKHNRETLWVCLDKYKGEPVLCCRTWYTDKGGHMRPGRSGLTVSVIHLPLLAKALCDAPVAAKAQILLQVGSK